MASSLEARDIQSVDLQPIYNILLEHGDEIVSNADSVAIELDLEKDVVKEVFRLAEKYNKQVYAVIRVTSAQDDSNINMDKAVNYGFYVVNNARSLVDCAVWNYYCNSVQDDMNQIGFRLLGDTLYIDGGNSPWTVEAITDDSITTMTEDFVNWVLDYSVALVKCIEGEIRSKVKITGSPVETNGSELKSEGITEKKELEEKLGVTLGLFYATR